MRTELRTNAVRAGCLAAAAAGGLWLAHARAPGRTTATPELDSSVAVRWTGTSAASAATLPDREPVVVDAAGDAPVQADRDSALEADVASAAIAAELAGDSAPTPPG